MRMRPGVRGRPQGGKGLTAAMHSPDPSLFAGQKQQ